ncbi:MAG: hypothetical protein HC892_16225 [Saprospiraceae bacterium]|nr:hypothetical protein [Saprospiraceae bacterium]
MLEVIRMFPYIRTAHQQHIQWQIQQMQMALEFNFARGVINRFLHTADFTLEFSKQFWASVDTWNTVV